MTEKLNVPKKANLNVYIVVNPSAGSYDEGTFNDLENTIKRTLQTYSLQKRFTELLDGNVIDSEKERSQQFNVITLKTQYANHARAHFSQLENVILKSVSLIIIVGGDGMVHEVVNGVSRNPNLSQYPFFAVCPMGTGNHLADLVGTSSSDLFLKALRNYSDLVETQSITENTSTSFGTKSIIPTEVVCLPTSNADRVKGEVIVPTLSINTIITGVPSNVNERATKIAPYLPGVLSFLKYELGTVFGMFDRDYLKIDLGRSSEIDNTNNNRNVIIDDVIGLFVQTTPSCGNGFVVDSRVTGNEEGLTYAYFKDVNTCKLLFELSKEKAGYNSQDLVRRYNIDREITLHPYGDEYVYVTVDGQNEKITLPVTVRRSGVSLRFLTV
ncbi:diacylglycerol kinase family lipid kinase [Yasminevirus sp. GU-2018]|uniref:Diacylglycerol kinase family lipid kinase n=1 Tax=Yasminevirus sp. GU-2018 TaxID=2420051 RepID=A0A5K0U8C2_9VIRU|nr:diacylglycerol kinase family lipid kinase [Yasminevirus sp. GU-2018]